MSVALEDYIEMRDALRAEGARLEAENERLRAAIAKHRKSEWGNSKLSEIDDIYDCELYAALKPD